MVRMMSKPMVLIVDDEKPTREGLRAALEERYDVYVAEDAAAAMTLLEQESFDVLLTDFRLPNEDGMKLIARAKSLPKPPVCILMTAYGSEELAVQAMKSGADDYLPKGRMQIDELDMRIARALRGQALEQENTALRERLDTKFGLEKIIGRSPAMEEVFDVVRQLAPTRATVLILGESGTGKELIAKAIHQLSPRRARPMVTVHCAALSPTLKGAFNGAHERRIGRFELAEGGTLFLDEIGEIDANTQVKLLRFLGERTFERVGSNKTLTSDVRVLAATNRSLAAQVKAGSFREDLYFRLRGLEIQLPPLRERKSDIPLLAQAFMREGAAAVEGAVVLARGERITPRELPADVRDYDPSRVTAEPGGSPPPAATVKEAEKQLIVRALKEVDGNRTTAAQRIGISRRTLHRKLKEYGLENL
jgi:DNA-binding NtrC family response regulator